MKKTNIFHFIAFATFITLAPLGVSACSAGESEIPSGEKSTRPHTVPLGRVCDGIISEEISVEVSSSLGVKEVHEERPRKSISEEVRRVFEKGYDSDFTLVCHFYAEDGDEESEVSIDFRRESGPPPKLRNSIPPWTVYRINENTLIKEGDEVTLLDTLCLTPNSPGEPEKRDTISLSLREEIGVSGEAKASILAATAEKVASGLECANDVDLPDDLEVTPLPRK